MPSAAATPSPLPLPTPARAATRGLSQRQVSSRSLAPSIAAARLPGQNPGAGSRLGQGLLLPSAFPGPALAHTLSPPPPPHWRVAGRGMLGVLHTPAPAKLRAAVPPPPTEDAFKEIELDDSMFSDKPGGMLGWQSTLDAGAFGASGDFGQQRAAVWTPRQALLAAAGSGRRSGGQQRGSGRGVQHGGNEFAFSEEPLWSLQPGGGSQRKLSGRAKKVCKNLHVSCILSYSTCSFKASTGKA